MSKPVLPDREFTVSGIKLDQSISESEIMACLDLQDEDLNEADILECLNEEEEIESCWLINNYEQCISRA